MISAFLPDFTELLSSTGPPFPALPHSPFEEMPPEAQAERRAARRCARYGYRLALHIVVWCAAGRTPTARAAVLCGARSRVSRTVRADREGALAGAYDDDGQLVPPVRRTLWLATRRRAWRALRKAPPRADGGCRTRWSGATRGITVAADTMRRGIPAVDGVGKRPPRVATDDAPHRVEPLARIRVPGAQHQRAEARVWAEALAIQRWPKVGSAWMPTGRHMTGMTPGTPAQRSLAGALDPTTGARRHGVAARKTHARFRHLRPRLEAGYPAARYPRRSEVVAHDTIQHAKAVEPGRAAPPRGTLRWWPPAGPRAHPIARAGGDGHDRCPRTHTPQRRQDRVAAGDAPLQLNGPGPYKLSALSAAPAVTAAVEHSTAEPHLQIAACVDQSHRD